MLSKQAEHYGHMQETVGACLITFVQIRFCSAVMSAAGSENPFDSFTVTSYPVN